MQVLATDDLIDPRGNDLKLCCVVDLLYLLCCVVDLLYLLCCVVDLLYLLCCVVALLYLLCCVVDLLYLLCCVVALLLSKAVLCSAPSLSKAVSCCVQFLL